MNTRTDLGIRPSLLLGKREAATALGVSLRTIDSLLAGGKLKARRIGRRVLINYEELKRFAAMEK